MFSFKRSLIGAAVALACASSAHAAYIDGNGTTAGDSGLLVGGLDWTPGTLLVNPVSGSVTDPQKGDVFQSYATGRLGQFLGLGGSPIGGTGLNSTYQWTFSIAFQEKVTDSAGSFAKFATVAGGTNFFNVYYNPSIVANPVNGTGYATDNAGAILVMSGTVLAASGALGVTSFTADTDENGKLTTAPLDDQGGGDGNQYPDVTSIQGTGGGKIAVQTTYVNSDFITNLGADPIIMKFDTQQNLAFTQTNPSSCMWDGTTLIAAAGPNTASGFECASAIGNDKDGYINGITGPSEILMTDSTTQLTHVPEPGSLALLSIGLLGLPLLRRRKQA